MANEQEPNKIIQIGARLKEAREKKNLTIEQAQKQTHIHSTVLSALEEGRCDEILTPTYVKSFLKKYASFLGIDAKSIADEYSITRGERPSKPALSISPQARPQAPEGPDPSGLLHVLKKAVVYVLIAAIIIFLGTKAMPLFKKIRFTPRPKNAAQRQTEKSSYKVEPKLKKAPRPSDTSKVTIAKNTPLELTIKTKQSVMVQLKKDGDVLFKTVMPKGSNESFTAKDSFNLYIARGEALELVLNGRSLGSPGKGVIKNLEITRKGIKIK